VSPERGLVRDLDALAAEARSQHVGWLLGFAHGYMVRSVRDEPLGRLAGLGRGADDRLPRALRPCGLRGLWSRATRELPFSAVLGVDRARREVRVAIEGRRARAARPGARHSAAAPR
jgi:hypothetical protein